ncbi:MAG: nickel-dependent lactate racemase [Chloroflexi bacterium]|nr:nickel-dependent lactate racemase [Chloroflexota bacterium]
MQKFEIPYGYDHVSFQLPGEGPADWIMPPETAEAPDPQKVVGYALDHPVGGIHLADFAGAHSAVIAINDKTRPVPLQHLLPPLLERLQDQLGLEPEAIVLIVGSGTHVPMRPKEYASILPKSILKRYPVISHDSDDTANLVDLGKTEQGTPIQINRRFMEADLKIAVSVIEPHHFMGFSGGAKSAAIGLAGRSTITWNHSMITHPNAKTGHFIDNPMRQDVEEIGRRISLQFVLNAVLNLDKRIVKAFAGSPQAVMEAGIPVVRQICQVAVPASYDLVIASPGGHPKDINFYQSEKALTHAALIARDGGTVILAAACPEGIGSQAYEEWMEGVQTFEEVLERFTREGFQVGPHKGYQVARIAKRVRVILASGIPADTVLKLLLTPTESVQAAIDRVFQTSPIPERVAILPYGTSTVPLLQE